MKTKPWILIVLSLIHILAPVGSFLFNALGSGRSFSEQWFYWTKVLPPQFLVVYVGLPILAGVFIYICKKWSYIAYLVCIGLILVSNLYSFATNVNWITFILLVGVLLMDLLIVGYFTVSAVRRVYFDPRLRWWETQPRYHYDMKATIDGVPVDITNISAGGLLFVSDYDFEVGKDVEIKWVDDVEHLPIGEVVYKIRRGDKLFNGMKFRDTETNLEALKKLILKLDQAGQINKDRLPGPEDSFGVWLKTLFTTGKGLVP